MSATGGDPGRGKTPSERHVDVPAAPNPLEELIRRPPRNSQELTGVTPDIHAVNRLAPIEAAPVVDVFAVSDRRLPDELRSHRARAEAGLLD